MKLTMKANIISFLTFSAVYGQATIAAADCQLNIGGTGTVTTGPQGVIGISGSIYSDGSSSNTCIGTSVLQNSTGVMNSALGYLALENNTTGDANVAVGAGSLKANTTGLYNTALGYSTLNQNEVGDRNTAVGFAAMSSNKTGTHNTALGEGALYFNSSGANNTALGVSALYANTTGGFNIALGAGAGSSWTTGGNNIAIGANAAYGQTTGSNNISIGAMGASGDNGVIRIGVKGTQTRTFISGIRGVKVTRGQTVQVDANGQLGVVSSSARYKERIKSMGDTSSAIMRLRPVTFHYREAEQDGTKPLQYGLIAEEVEQVMPDLVIYNNDGTPESVAYDVLPSLLLNEYQKQSRELDATKAELTEAKARLDAMEAQIAAMKLMLSKLADANASKVMVASSP